MILNQPILLSLGLLAFFLSTSLACTCVKADIYGAAKGVPDVFTAKVITPAFDITDLRIGYVVQVQFVYKGCQNVSDLLLLQTNDNSAACGAVLETSEEYIFFGEVSGWTMFFTLCSSQKPTSLLTPEESDYLNSIFNPCTKECANSTLVNCFAAPCRTSRCDVEGAVCEDNYCGGCNAYWFLDGQRVCFVNAPTSPSNTCR